MRRLLLLPALAMGGVTFLVIQPLILLGADLMGVTWFNEPWKVAGVEFGLSDAVVAGLSFCALGSGFYRGPAQIPWFGAWVVLGLLRTTAYLVSDGAQGDLTDPLGVTYQVYRFGWREILYYPLVCMLVRDRRQMQIVLSTMIAGACFFGIQGIIEGYAGGEVSGPFSSKNAFGGALVIPTALAFAGFAGAESRREQIFFLPVFLLLARAVSLSGSRGALVATVVALGAYTVCLWSTPSGRQNLVKLMGVAAVGVVLLFAMKPDLLNRPAISHMLTTTDGADDHNFRWRMEERWPHFIAILQDNPWFGRGTDVDLSLGTWGNTPHNGYLSLAMTHGIPGLLIYFALMVKAAFDSLRLFLFSKTRSDSRLGLALMCAVGGIMIHNCIDAIMLIPWTQTAFWILAAFAGLLVRGDRMLCAPAPRPVPIESANALPLAA